MVAVVVVVVDGVLLRVLPSMQLRCKVMLGRT